MLLPEVRDGLRSASAGSAAAVYPLGRAVDPGPHLGASPLALRRAQGGETAAPRRADRRVLRAATEEQGGDCACN